MTTLQAKVQRCRLRYPELLRYGAVIELAAEFGVCQKAARKLIEGEGAPVPQHSFRTGTRAFYVREKVLTVLAGEAAAA